MEPGPGGAGNGGGSVTNASSPSAQINFHIHSNDGNGSQTSTQTSTTPVPFHVPQSFDVGGELANGTVVLTYTSCSNAAVTCTFKGGSSSGSPATILDQELGRTANFVSCTDNQPASALRCGTSFTVTVNPAPANPVSVNFPLDDRGCTANFDLLTPYQTRLMHDTFSWSSAKTVPLNTDGTPTLYYAWVYLHNAADLLMLRQLYVHILSRPLFTQELQPFAGKCGTFINPGDGTGAFVPVVMPAEVYNVLVNVQDPNFRKQNNIKDGNAVFFDAIVLRNADVPAGARNANGSISFNILKNSGFRYLDYEGSPLPSQGSIVQNGGAVAVVLQDIASFVLGAVKTIGQTITNALGDLDALFNGRVTFNITINAANHNPIFGTTNALTRGWGPQGGSPIGAEGLEVSLLGNFLGFIPETFISHTDSNGFVSIRTAKHSGNARGSGICIQMSNRAAWITSFLMPNDLCDLNGFDTSVVPPGSPQLVSDSLSVSDFSQDRTINWFAQDRQLSTMYEMTDTFDYVNSVFQFQTATAHVLVGDMADAFTSFRNNRAFTHCLRLRNETIADLKNLLAPYTNDLLFAGAIDAISVVAANFADTDIVMPDDSIDGPGSREVGTHEFGHFVLCNMILGGSTVAIDNLLGDTILNHGDDLDRPTRYINEAFADFISGQVTSDANYSWLDARQINNKVCVAAPCYDRNFTGVPSGSKDVTGIARTATLLHDAFDGPNAKGKAIPDEADAWIKNAQSVAVYTPTTYGNTDGPNTGVNQPHACRLSTGRGFTDSSSNPVACVGSENVALPSGSLGTFGAILGQTAPGVHNYLEDQLVYRALDQLMISNGYNWCRRCELFALHTPANSNDNLGPIPLLQQCVTGGDAFLQQWSLPSGSPPDPSLRLEAASCTPCPGPQAPDANGECQVCNGPPDAVLDGLTTALGNYSFDTMTSATGDACPLMFVLEVRNPDAFFSRGAPRIAGSVGIASGSLTQALCQQPYSATFFDESTGTTNFVLENTVTQTGVFGTGGIAMCSNLPGITIASVGQLRFGSDPIRFTTPSIRGVNFSVSVGTSPQ